MAQRSFIFARPFKAIVDRFGVNRRSSEAAGADLPLPGILRTYGQSVSSDSALKNTAFYAAIRLVSENISSLPKAVREFTGKGWRDNASHPAALVINHPNDYTNAFSFWSAIITWIKGWGNAYALIERRGGVPVALHQLHPSWVKLTLVNGRKYYQVRATSQDFRWLDGVYSDEDILHFMELTLDGVQGINPVLYNASAIGKAAAMEAFCSDFYRKGGSYKAVMETEGSLDEETYRKFMKRMKDYGNFGTPLLEFGIKYKNLPVDPLASQLVQSEVLSVQDICRIVNVPPHMVAELSHATFSNIEHQTIQFVQYSLRPIIKRIEMELESKLFTERERDRFDVKFIIDGLLRGDTSARSAYYHNAILDGYMSRNEVRELEGLERKKGLDSYMKPVNYEIVENNNE